MDLDPWGPPVKFSWFTQSSRENGPRYGLFKLTETDSGTDSDSDSKPNCYVVLFRTCWHCTDSAQSLLPISSTVQESESESILESVSSCLNEPVIGCLHLRGPERATLLVYFMLLYKQLYYVLI